MALGGLLVTLAITTLAKRYGQLLDAFYPYVTRWVQTALARISGSFPFPLWQVLGAGLLILLAVTLVLMIRKKKCLIRFLGWVLAAVSLIWCGHTALYGLNHYASPLAQDIHLAQRTLTQEDLENALVYFRDQAGQLAPQLPRDGAGNPVYEDFDALAEKAGRGFENLTRAGYSVFAGSSLPVKKLLFSKLFAAMDIDGIYVALTGEASVNPAIARPALPFVMCRQMARRLCIAPAEDAALAAFLACRANEDLQFQYAAYCMAYGYCLHALAQTDTAALGQIHNSANALFRQDLQAYKGLFTQEKYDAATLLVHWYLQQTQQQEEDQQNKFDPTDKNYISGILGDTND